MRVTTSKSKIPSLFTSQNPIRMPKERVLPPQSKNWGTLAELSERLGTDRDGVMAWAKEQARIENRKI